MQTPHTLASRPVARRRWLVPAACALAAAMHGAQAQSHFADATLPEAVAAPQADLVGADYQHVQQLLHARQYTQALQAADAWLLTHPRDPQMRLLKSRILTAQGQRAKAQAMLVALTQDFPEIPEPFNNLAVLYAAQGHIDQAREALEAALRSNPHYAAALENLGDIYRQMAYNAYARALQLQPASRQLPGKMRRIQP